METRRLGDELHVSAIGLGCAGISGAYGPTDDADGIFLKGGVGGYMQTWYELISLQR